MNYITTTQLRTRVPEFVEALLAGKSINLIHRSQNLGTITLEPVRKKITNHARLAKNILSLNLPFINKRMQRANYHNHLVDKYGQSFS